jgi:hypothetical protein
VGGIKVYLAAEKKNKDENTGVLHSVQDDDLEGKLK